ncbi:MAG: DJ-1/PfpI family protein [Pseudomonadota bacterium]
MKSRFFPRAVFVATTISFYVVAFQLSTQPCFARTAGQLSGKKVAMIIASNNFHDNELAKPRVILAKAGAEITLVSSTTKESTGMLGGKEKPTKLIDETKASDYDAIIFVGGSGSKEYFESPHAMRLARNAVKQNKVLGAICLAPAILAHAGVLRGKKATVWSGAKDHLRTRGAYLQKANVVRDGRIITANGPAAAAKFGQMLAEVLASK